MQLQREAPAPLYIQLKDSLLATIANGGYHAHQRLPSERELCTTFGVSRMTVRQALLDLVREGAIYTRVGKGTFVAAPKINQELRAVSGFSQDVRERGGHPSSRVVHARIVGPSPLVAASLRIAPVSQVVQLARVRLADEIPLAWETAYLPHGRFHDLLHHDWSTASLYDVLEAEYHVLLIQAEQTIEAALATEEERSMLQLPSPSPVLRMERLTHDGAGLPIEYVHSAYRGDRYKFRSTLQPRGGAN